MDEKIDRLFALMDIDVDAIPRMRELAKALLRTEQEHEQIDILTDALKWYADARNYERGTEYYFNGEDEVGRDGPSEVQDDYGYHAREALQRCGVKVE